MKNVIIVSDDTVSKQFSSTTRYLSQVNAYNATSNITGFAKPISCDDDTRIIWLPLYKFGTLDAYWPLSVESCMYLFLKIM